MLPLWLDWYILGTVVVFGAIVGSFLNVVIYRFHTGRSLSGSSHCMSCQRCLRWYELFPIFSYISLRGRCRTCHSRIPSRYLMVELLTAASFLIVYLNEGSISVMLAHATLMSLLVIVVVYDIYHYIIPNELVGAISAVALAIAGIRWSAGVPLETLVPAVLSAIAAFAFYGGLWKVSGGRWIGFGDAKLAIPLGFLVSFPSVFSMIVLSFWVGAVVSVAMVVLQHLMRRGQIALRIFGSPITMKSEIPFAPFLVAGFVLCYFYRVDVLSIVDYVL